jgi:hypothetical protein
MCCQALPAKIMAPSEPGADLKQTIIWREDDAVCIRIRRRKNRPQGSGVLKRICTCRGGPRTCAVHCLWDEFLGRLPPGTSPWASVSESSANRRLRMVLGALGVTDAQKYRTQDLRRGHAEVCVRMASASCIHCSICVFFAGYAGIWLFFSRDPEGRTVAICRLHKLH